MDSFTTLLAAAGPCDQQNQADKMIDLAKQLKNDPEMITLAQIFRQQPRNTVSAIPPQLPAISLFNAFHQPSSESVQYCQQPPRNSELSGLFQCQFSGAKTQTFVGGVQVGSPGTIPLGLNSPLSPPGSCPANPNGPVPDGQQLVDITQNPGGASGGVNKPPVPGGNPDVPANTSTPVVKSPTPTQNVPTPTQSVPNSQGGNFKLQNGKDAQKLNAQFSTLTPNSSCTGQCSRFSIAGYRRFFFFISVTDGQNGCVSGGFAQCVNGKFAITQCSSPLICAALPLVNSPGTSITCTTQQDALTRIANTGAQGGLTGSG